VIAKALKLSSDEILFYAVRGLGLFIKPLTLWVLIKLNYLEASAFVATFYFAVATTFIALNSEAHIPLYKIRYGKDSDSSEASGLYFRSYIRDFTAHVLVFLPFVTLGFLLYFSDVITAFTFTIFVVLEKFWDEVQRNLIFSRSYQKWAFWFIIRITATSMGICIGLLMGWSIYLCILVGLAVMTVALARNLISKRLRKMMKRASISALRMKTIQFLNIYRRRFMFGQLVALASKNLLSVDKWMAGLFLPERILVELVLVSQVGAMFHVLIDNIYFSRKRDRFVQVKNGLNEIVKWDTFLYVTIGYITFSVLLFTVYSNGLGVLQLTVKQCILSISIFVVAGLGRPLCEHAFWHVPRSYAATIDVTAVLIWMTNSIFLRESDDFLTILLVGGLIVNSVRIVIYVILCKKSIVKQQSKVHIAK
jgi:hypothetical protein